MKRPRLLPLLALLSLASSLTLPASTWTGGNGDWTSDGSPGWNGTGIPNGVGAIVSKTDTTSATLTQNTGGAVTLGTITLGGSSGGAVFNLSPTSSGFILDQDGAGAGFATISNTNSGTGTTRVALSNTGSITLADDLLISNSGGSTNSTSISITSVIAGTGNVKISNVSNSLSVGTINLGATNTFMGNVVIEKGAVTYATGTTGMGNSANAVTLGSLGGGSASLISTASGSASTLANNITVVSGSGGVLLLGSTGTGAASTTYSGTVLLNGDLSVTSARTGVNDVRFTNAISGTGSFSTQGTGNISLRGVNTYTGNTVLGGGQFSLTDNAQLTFVIGASGVNNSLSGTANQTALLDGDFNFDLSLAADNGLWNIVEVASLNETFGGTFFVNSTLGAFAESSDIWSLVNGDTTWTFTEATGILSAVTVPEGSSALLLALGGLGTVLHRRRRR